MIDLSQVKDIIIPEGRVREIADASGTVLWTDPWDYIITPYYGDTVGEMPVTQVPVKKGDVLTIEYYLTKRQGYIYDARNLGQDYYGSVSSTKYPMNANEVGVVCTKTVTASKDGYIMISGYYSHTSRIGKLSETVTDRCYGYYVKVRVN